MCICTTCSSSIHTVALSRSTVLFKITICDLQDSPSELASCLVESARVDTADRGEMAIDDYPPTRQHEDCANDVLGR